MFSLIEKLANVFKRKPEPDPEPVEEKAAPEDDELVDTMFTTHARLSRFRSNVEYADFINKNAIPVKPENIKLSVKGDGMDVSNAQPVKTSFNVNQQIVPEALFSWYVTQGFIGYQTCAIISQHWLVSKACSVKGDDAVRNGYEVTINDGNDVNAEMIAAITKADKAFNVKQHLENASRFNEIFGIRHVLFVVDSPDPDYYEKPFNPDGVRPGSYRGITQVDPYWVSPYLDAEAVQSPASRDFYEPTYWVISGQRYHKSHFVLLRGPEVPDILKPSYLYGGVSLTQRIYERVYAAERTANESPQLAMTKRLNVRKMDIAKAVANAAGFQEGLEFQAATRDNYGILAIDKADEAQQLETSLADLDDVTMTMYQLVASVANVPATKLLGTSPKGFNATGDHEIKTYNQELETIQENDLTAIVDRHHICVGRSIIFPRFNTTPFDISIEWNPVDVPTSKEQAEINRTNAETDSILQNTGAVDAYEIRDRVIADNGSGYNGLEAVERPDEEDDGILEPPTTPEATGPPQDNGQQFGDGADSVAMDVIRKEGSQYYVYSESGKRLGGPYSSKAEAAKRLGEIEYFKKKAS
jgi:phage-related protein (TIGR01555 family)